MFEMKNVAQIRACYQGILALSPLMLISFAICIHSITNCLLSRALLVFI